MAWSGIAEHNEARRKDRIKDGQCYRIMMMREEAERGPDPARLVDQQYDNSYDAEAQYMRKCGSPPGLARSGHDPVSVDKQRRIKSFENSKTHYSAKLGKRFSSTDYMSQW